jgi:RNA polymerase sigma factor (sigma-70 family)
MIQAVDVSDLVAAAAGGDRGAWDGLVERYMPLVLSVVRRYRLNDKDAEDVSQTVWLRLVEHLDKIREPRALPGWISTTTRHEALAVIKAGRRTEPVDLESFLQYVVVDGPLIEDDLLRIERAQALRDGLDELSPDQRRLLLLLVSDPPTSYQDISKHLGMPVGSIGPTRARCLRRLRATPSVQSLFGSASASDAGEGD